MSKDVESEDLESKDVESKNVKSKDVERQDIENEDINILDMMGLFKRGTGKYFQRHLYFILDQKHTQFYM